MLLPLGQLQTHPGSQNNVCPDAPGHCLGLFKGRDGEPQPPTVHAVGTAIRCTAALRLDSSTSAETKRGVKLTGDA